MTDATRGQSNINTTTCCKADLLFVWDRGERLAGGRRDCIYSRLAAYNPMDMEREEVECMGVKLREMVELD
ncbi:hypothetical protein Pmani_019376 [Petrolisthes manimaculis]|uniref:Uncharacterized protein n=1 Tax=Petrolisthes manimaculis TaxID=1843537 RepID=A0AAE1PIK2_9EUCA|nr:hypothetical protein Pmani_019376 [Petrolisthes manimaculis]